MSSIHLVVIRHLLDDIPIKLCIGKNSLDDAREVVAQLREKYVKEFDGNMFALTPDWWAGDASTPTCIVIVEFDDTGEPVKIAETFSLEEDEDAKANA